MLLPSTQYSSILPASQPDQKPEALWIPRDSVTGDALTTGPVTLDAAVELQKQNPKGVRLDTTSGGGSANWTYSMDNATALAHRILGA